MYLSVQVTVDLLFLEFHEEGLSFGDLYSYIKAGGFQSLKCLTI